MALKPHRFQTRSRFLSDYPKIILTPEAYARMSAYVDVANQEVGWLGTAERLPDGDFLIDKLFLLDQNVGAMHTELSVQGLNELAEELLSLGEEGIADWSNMRFWGHSHVFMGTNPSVIDENTMALFSESGHDWFIRAILNKYGQAEFSLFLFKEGLRIDDVAWIVSDRPGTAGVQPAQAGWLQSQDSVLYDIDIFQKLRQEVLAEYQSKVRK